MIPVYENMPETPCPVPEKAYNPNNWLKSLKLYDINGDTLELTPSFSVTKEQEYNLIVNYETEYIKVGAKTVSSLATVLGDGYIYPKVGENRLIIPVKAENGDVRQYVVNIVREEKPEDCTTCTPTEEPEDPEGSPTPINIDINIVTGTPAENPTPEPEPSGSGEPTPSGEVTPTPTPDIPVVG